MTSRARRACAAACITAAVFALALAAPLTVDDRFIVELHPVVNGSLSPLAAFDHGWWQGVAGAQGNEYRPLSTLLLALEVELGNGAPWVLRAFGLLLHLATCGVLFRVARRVGLSARASELAAWLFALHPIHVEVVASAVGQAELLQTLLVLVAVLAFLTPGRLASALWPVAIVTAVLSKESAIVAPVLVAGTALWVGLRAGHVASSPGSPEAPPRRPWLALMPCLLLPLYAWLRISVLGAFTGQRAVSFIENPLVQASDMERLWAGPVLLGRYLWLMLFPVQLSADYSFQSIPLPSGPLDARFLVPAGVGLGLLVGALRRPASVVSLALGWFVVCLGIASNVLFPIGTIFGERLAYMASVAVALVVGAGLDHLLDLRPRQARVWVLALVALFAFRVAERCSDLLSEERLFAAVVRVYPSNVKAHYNLAVALDARGDGAAVVKHLDAALAVRPDYPDALLARSMVRLARADLAGAEADLRRVPERSPGLAEAWLGLGQAALRRGDCAGARPHLDRAVELDPRYGELVERAVCASAGRGDPDLARPARRE